MNVPQPVRTRSYPDPITGVWQLATECLVCGTMTRAYTFGSQACAGLYAHPCHTREVLRAAHR